MRTNIDIDDALMSKAMQAGPYVTKKEAVEAGLKLLARQVVYREILKWRGKLKWEGDESIDWTKPETAQPPVEPAAAVPKAAAKGSRASRTTPPAAKPTLKVKRRAGR